MNGGKETMNKAKLKLDLTGNLIKDPDSKWDSTPFSRFMRDFYNKFIIPSRVSEIEGLLESDVKGLKEELKSFLELMGRR